MSSTGSIFDSMHWEVKEFTTAQAWTPNQ